MYQALSVVQHKRVCRICEIYSVGRGVSTSYSSSIKESVSRAQSSFRNGSVSWVVSSYCMKVYQVNKEVH